MEAYVEEMEKQFKAQGVYERKDVLLRLSVPGAPEIKKVQLTLLNGKQSRVKFGRKGAEIYPSESSLYVLCSYNDMTPTEFCERVVEALDW